MLVENVHFIRDSIKPAKLGRKAMAVNISDIAAMGGRPLYGLLSIAVPADTDVRYTESMVSGITSMADECRVNLVGGDTSLSPKGIAIDITLIGEAEKDSVIYRSGAAPGQSIFVTGPLGASGAGLDIMKDTNR